MHPKAIFESFKNMKALVIGDLMIDAYIWGSVDRISPEAPVPIIDINKREDRLGGAANVALNLRSLGAKTTMCGLVGEDFSAKTLKGLFEEEAIQTDGIVHSSFRPTTIKTRIISGKQHLLRVDEESKTYINAEETKALKTKFDQLINAEDFDVIILEDYNKGVLSPEFIEHIINAAQEKGIKTTVDPKKEHFLAYKGVDLFKPNLKELKEGLKLNELKGDDTAALNKALDTLENLLHNKISFTTLSEHGVYIKKGADSKHIPAFPRKIIDVSGAGDSVISVASLCLAAGMDIEDIALWSNLAGGIVCESVGVIPINAEQLLQEVEEKYAHVR